MQALKQLRSFSNPIKQPRVRAVQFARPMVTAARPCTINAQRRYVVLVHANVSSSGGAGDFKPEEFGLTPGKPKTAYGEQLAYYLAMEPQLFRAAVEDKLARLKGEKDEREKKKKQLGEPSVLSMSSMDEAQIVLNQRMDKVRAREASNALEDLMYVSVLERFVALQVEMLPRMDGFVDVAPTSLTTLTEGIHSREALELVREHLIGVMGPTTSQQFSNVAVKMSKFQMAQVYAASIMFGYFLRRVDKRFQLERAVGTAPVPPEEAVKRLEKLFAMADADHPIEAETDKSDAESSSSSSSSGGGGGGNVGTGAGTQYREAPLHPGASSSKDSFSGSGSSSGRNLPVRKEKSALRQYVETFDQAAMVETARIVSMEGAALVERQTSAVLGDIKKLTQQIQEAVGKDVESMEQVMQRMAVAVEGDRVETVTMTVGTQRRAVLEAVAFGSFLRDVETWVQEDYNLLTPLPPPRMGGGSLDGGDAPLV